MLTNRIRIILSILLCANVVMANGHRNANPSTNGIYISPRGNDRNTGTFGKPFKTLGRALSAAANLKGQDVSIRLFKGTYYLPNTLIIRSMDMKARSLTISARPGDQVIISGGRKLELKWEPYRNGIYRARVLKGISFESLFINGKRQHLARYPNYDTTARIYHGTARDVTDPARIAKWKDPAGGYVHGLHSGEWGSFDYRITGRKTDGTLALEGGWQNNRPAGLHEAHRFVENIFEELDAPNEWYLDRKDGLLYYYPGKGTDIQTALVEVSKLKESIVLSGTPEKPVTNVHISGLTFLHNERTFMETREPLLRSDWTLYRGGSVVFDRTRNCTVESCAFTGLGGNAVMLTNYNFRDTIRNCHISEIDASAICFVGSAKAVRSPLFSYESEMAYGSIDKTPGPLSNDHPDACVAINNLIHDIGQLEKQATGVEISMSSAISVLHNSIYNTPRAGINIGDGCWGGHNIAYNDVFNTVLETGDHGAFNSWGRDRYWDHRRSYMDSLVAVHPELIRLDAVDQIQIHDNRFRCDHGWDIDLDDGSSNYHIYNNVCLNGGIKLREGFYRTVENNIIVNNSFHPHVWFKNSGDIFRRNIVSSGYLPIGISYWGDVIDSNFFPDSIALNSARKNGTDKNSMAGPLRFVNAETGDFRPLSSSRAYLTGFKAFSMDQFGVQDPRLKRLALRAPIPAIIDRSKLEDRSSVISYGGAKLKSVQGLGERSAYGLPDETGVIVLEPGKGKPFEGSGVKAKDVILVAEGQKVRDVKTFIDICRSVEWKGSTQVTVIRNQKRLELELHFR